MSFFANMILNYGAHVELNIRQKFRHFLTLAATSLQGIRTLSFSRPFFRCRKNRSKTEIAKT